MKRPGLVLIVLMTFIASAVTALAVPQTAQAATNIVANGKAQAQIVIDVNPTRAVKLAAKELQAYLEKISGAKLAIVNAAADDATVKIYVGQSEGTRSLGITADGLPDDGAYRIVSGDRWLVLIGQDKDFVPPEPWGRSPANWQKVGQVKWDEITGEHWDLYPASAMYKNYNRELDLWSYDKRGSLNAVYAFIRSLGVRWYMPGQLGEFITPEKTIALPHFNKTVKPEIMTRRMSFARFALIPVEHVLYDLRLGNNKALEDLSHGMRHLSHRPYQREHHPEYYALINGKRDTADRTPALCLSSNELFDANVRYVKMVADTYHMSIVSVMPDDGFASICQCDDCKNQATLKRGYSGWYSNYVWDYVNRVAIEVYKTHPDVKIICAAYSTYRLAPTNIKKLSPNILVSIVGGRSTVDISDEAFKDAETLRKQWQALTDNKLSIFLNYPFTQRGVFLPQYFPHIIARGIHEGKGQIRSEDIWIPENRGLYQPGVNHLNAYVMAACMWDADTDIDALLNEYYAKYYGPAASQMKAFIEYSEAHYTTMGKDVNEIEKTLAYFDTAKAAVAPDSDYGKRIAMVDDFLKELRNRGTQLGKGRVNVPTFDFANDLDSHYWLDHGKIGETLVMDGKLDEPFWQAYPNGGSMRNVETGAEPGFDTQFYIRWWKDNLYIGIICKDKPGRKPIAAAAKDGDPAIWNGDTIEILLETDSHSYYQIVVDPADHVMSLDRGVPASGWYSWSSQATAVTHINENGWTAEIKIPVATESTDPLHNVTGRKPSKALPWYFNIGRARVGSNNKVVELSMYSPTGQKHFHDIMKFAKLYLR